MKYFKNILFASLVLAASIGFSSTASANPVSDLFLLLFGTPCPQANEVQNAKIFYANGEMSNQLYLRYALGRTQSQPIWTVTVHGLNSNGYYEDTKILATKSLQSGLTGHEFSRYHFDTNHPCEYTSNWGHRVTATRTPSGR